MSELTEEILLSNSDKPPTKGTINVIDFTSAQRTMRALTRGILGLIISLALLVVPMLHLVLTPLGLIITGVLVRAALVAKKVLSHGKGVCPACQGTVAIYKRPYRFPFSEICEGCHRELLITKI